jgi:hypothetical protein
VERAFGTTPGVPQTPELLTALLSRDVAAQLKALRDLDQLVHHLHRDATGGVVRGRHLR